MDTFWATLSGSAIGVVAGVFVQFMCQKAFDYFRDQRIRASIVKEARFNLLVINDVETAITYFRNALNANTLDAANFHVPWNRGLHIQANNLASQGRLYEFFDNEHLARLQRVTEMLTPATAGWYNAEMERRKAAFVAEPAAFDRAEAVNFLHYADGQVRELRAALQGLVDGFGPKKAK